MGLLTQGFAVPREGRPRQPLRARLEGRCHNAGCETGTRHWNINSAGGLRLDAPFWRVQGELKVTKRESRWLM